MEGTSNNILMTIKLKVYLLILNNLRKAHVGCRIK